VGGSEGGENPSMLVKIFADSFRCMQNLLVRIVKGSERSRTPRVLEGEI
jgi:hypothetical protein